MKLGFYSDGIGFVTCKFNLIHKKRWTHEVISQKSLASPSAKSKR